MLKILVRIAVSVAALAFVLRSIDLELLWMRVRAMNPAWLLLAIAAYLFMLTVSVWRWHRLLHAQHIEVPRKRLLL